jgi:hypothetical protein
MTANQAVRRTANRPYAWPGSMRTSFLTRAVADLVPRSVMAGESITSYAESLRHMAKRASIVGVTDEQIIQLYGNIGTALIGCQIAENHMRRLLDYGLSDRKSQVERALGRAPDKRTLGAFITAIRKRVKLDSFLRSFLERRNRFVHRFTEELFFSIRDTEKFAETYLFVRTLRMDAVRLIKILTPALNQWMESQTDPNLAQNIEFLLMLCQDESNAAR